MEMAVILSYLWFCFLGVIFINLATILIYNRMQVRLSDTLKASIRETGAVLGKWFILIPGMCRVSKPITLGRWGTLVSKSASQSRCGQRFL